VVRRAVLACIAAVSIAAFTASCTAQSEKSAAPPSTKPTANPTSISPTTTPGTASHTVWLCRPGHRPDPCVSDLSTTVVGADGRRTTVSGARTSGRRSADCFYAYPTVSGESGRNADLRIQNAERQVALVQAARFSAVCDVWAPVYRQRTISDLFNLTDTAPDSIANRRAYASLRSGWHSFLAAHDARRPIVLLGHSQGASMLIRLIRDEVDRNAAMRQRIAVAVVLGGNVAVRTGRTLGGDFTHVPLCTRPGQAGCVIAYSSFPGQPPAAAFFGRPGRGVSLLSGDQGRGGLQVACVNPVAPGSSAALDLHPYFPSTLASSGASTPWTTYAGYATAQCRSGGGATWLQVSPTAASRSAANLLKERLGALWGFHDVDVNLALGDLVADVAASVRGWHRTHH
jgi:hypothetical protein